MIQFQLKNNSSSGFPFLLGRTVHVDLYLSVYIYKNLSFLDRSVYLSMYLIYDISICLSINQSIHLHVSIYLDR